MRKANGKPNRQIAGVLFNIVFLAINIMLLMWGTLRARRPSANISLPDLAVPHTEPQSGQLKQCLAMVRKLQVEQAKWDLEISEKLTSTEQAIQTKALSVPVVVGSLTHMVIEPVLVIGIPSAPRPKEAGWPLEQASLYQTLLSIVEEVSASAVLRRSVQVRVMNMRPGSHDVFNKCEKAFSGHSDWLLFKDKPQGDDKFNSLHPYVTEPPFGEEEEFRGSNKERPTDNAWRQTRDVISLLEWAQGTSAYYYFAEDDMRFCGNTAMALLYLIDKAARTATSPFAAIRCSFGLNGIVMHNGGALREAEGFEGKIEGHYPNDVKAFADYLYRYQFRRPPDHLATEFFAQETSVSKAHFSLPLDFKGYAGRATSAPRRVAAFRYNLVQHIGGRSSTLREEEAWSMPDCYAELTEPQVFAVEAWSPQDCPHSDLWPCDEKTLMAKFGKLRLGL